MYAVGDCAKGVPRFTHTSGEMAKLVVQNALAGDAWRLKCEALGRDLEESVAQTALMLEERETLKDSLLQRGSARAERCDQRASMMHILSS